MYYIYIQLHEKKQFVSSVRFFPSPNTVLALVYDFFLRQYPDFDFDKEEVIIAIEKKGFNNFYTLKDLLDKTK